MENKPSVLFCHICYTMTEEEFICDRCEQHYCEECSYVFTIHYQYEGGLCYHCSDQSRRKPLLKDVIRDNKLKLIGF